MDSLIFTKIFIYVAILLIGFLGKKIGAFKREHTKFLNNIICYITLPAAIINGFQGVELTLILFSGLAVGLVANILLLVLPLFMGIWGFIVASLVNIFYVTIQHIYYVRKSLLV